MGSGRLKGLGIFCGNYFGDLNAQKKRSQNVSRVPFLTMELFEQSLQRGKCPLEDCLNSLFHISQIPYFHGPFLFFSLHSSHSLSLEG